MVVVGSSKHTVGVEICNQSLEKVSSMVVVEKCRRKVVEEICNRL